MKDYKLKLILSILAGIVFSFMFIILAFALPVEKEQTILKANKNLLEKISDNLKK
ncbi:MAG: hypothetical protein L3I99_01810 [Sulfurimonas sp.]|nr:hypothetical protein [Sulfurimonas sp.]